MSHQLSVNKLCRSSIGTILRAPLKDNRYSLLFDTITQAIGSLNASLEMSHIACPEVNGEEEQQFVHCVSSSFSLNTMLLSVLSEGKISAKLI